MKKIIILSFLLLLPTLLFAKKSGIYEVVGIESPLGIHERPDENSLVLYQLTEGNTVVVREAKKGWVKIFLGDQYGYVKAEHLEWREGHKFRLGPDSVISDSATRKASMVLMYAFFIVGIALAVVHFMYRDGSPVYGGALFVYSALFTLLCLIELTLAYFFISGFEVYKFEWMDRVPLLFVIVLSIVFFVLFVGILIGQLIAFAGVIGDMQDYFGAYFDYRTGLIGFCISAAGYLVCEHFFEKALLYVYIFYGITQLIQIVIVFVASGKQWGFAIFASFLLIVAPLSIIAMFVPVMFVALIGVVALFWFAVAGSAPLGMLTEVSGGSSSSSSGTGGSRSFEERQGYNDMSGMYGVGSCGNCWHNHSGHCTVLNKTVKSSGSCHCYFSK